MGKTSTTDLIAPAAVLAATITVALQIRDRMKADGATTEECHAALEKTLRVSWPQRQEWKYLCHDCCDYGLIMVRCNGDRACGRYQRHLPHDYGTPCWCSRGEPFKAKPKADDDFTQAGTAKRSMTRWGR